MRGPGGIIRGMTIRAKFTLQSRKRTSWVNNDGTLNGPYPDELDFWAVYDDGIPENQRFAKATLTGHLTMSVDNPSALEQFQVGKSYYLDLTPVDPPAAPEPAETTASA